MTPTHTHIPTDAGLICNKATPRRSARVYPAKQPHSHQSPPPRQSQQAQDDGRHPMTTTHTHIPTDAGLICNKVISENQQVHPMIGDTP